MASALLFAAVILCACWVQTHGNMGCGRAAGATTSYAKFKYQPQAWQYAEDLLDKYFCRDHAVNTSWMTIYIGRRRLQSFAEDGVNHDVATADKQQQQQQQLLLQGSSSDELSDEPIEQQPLQLQGVGSVEANGVSIQQQQQQQQQQLNGGASSYSRARDDSRRSLVAGVDPEALVPVPGTRALTGEVQVHLVWFGSWRTTDATVTKVSDFVAGLGCSDWWNVLSSYYQLNSNLRTVPIAGPLLLGSSIILNGSAISDDACGPDGLLSAYGIVFAAQVALGINNPKKDVFMIIPSADVAMPSNFGTRVCGWHNNGGTIVTPFLYGLVINPTTSSNCASYDVGAPTPNGDFQADTIVNIVAHEMAEMVLAPQRDTWRDSHGKELCDKCQWRFDPTDAPTVSVAGSMWKVQQMWDNANLLCVNALSPSPSPPSPSPKPPPRKWFGRKAA